MINIDIDVMVNNGRTFYATLKGKVYGKLVIDGDNMIELLTPQIMEDFVLEKLPTLKNRKFIVYNN